MHTKLTCHFFRIFHNIYCIPLVPCTCTPNRLDQFRSYCVNNLLWDFLFYGILIGWCFGCFGTTVVTSFGLCIICILRVCIGPILINISKSIYMNMAQLNKKKEVLFLFACTQLSSSNGFISVFLYKSLCFFCAAPSINLHTQQKFMLDLFALRFLVVVLNAK